MPITSSISKNTITFTATAVGANGIPKVPDDDEPIVFTVYANNRRTVRYTETQALGDTLGGGAFAIDFVPAVVETVYCEATFIVDGKQQTERIPHKVRWV